MIFLSALCRLLIIRIHIGRKRKRERSLIGVCFEYACVCEECAGIPLSVKGTESSLPCAREREGEKRWVSWIGDIEKENKEISKINKNNISKYIFMII